MSRPELKTDGDLLPGLAAVALFVVFAAAFLTASSPEPASGSTGFGEGAAVMKSLGAAMFGIEASQLVAADAAVPADGFLVVFEIIDIVLVAALVGAVMLARREDAGENVTVGTGTSGSSERATPPAATDGGEVSETSRDSSALRSGGGTASVGSRASSERGSGGGDSGGEN